MSLRVAQCLLLFILVAMLVTISGCATEPENASVRPWNTPQGWENGLPVDMNGQHE